MVLPVSANARWMIEKRTPSLPEQDRDTLEKALSLIPLVPAEQKETLIGAIYELMSRKPKWALSQEQDVVQTLTALAKQSEKGAFQRQVEVLSKVVDVELKSDRHIPNMLKLVRKVCDEAKGVNDIEDLAKRVCEAAKGDESRVDKRTIVYNVMINSQKELEEALTQLPLAYAIITNKYRELKILESSVSPDMFLEDDICKQFALVERDLDDKINLFNALRAAVSKITPDDLEKRYPTSRSGLHQAAFPDDIVDVVQQVALPELRRIMGELTIKITNRIQIDAKEAQEAISLYELLEKQCPAQLEEIRPKKELIEAALISLDWNQSTPPVALIDIQQAQAAMNQLLQVALPELERIIDKLSTQLEDGSLIDAREGREAVLLYEELYLQCPAQLEGIRDKKELIETALMSMNCNQVSTPPVAPEPIDREKAKQFTQVDEAKTDSEPKQLENIRVKTQEELRAVQKLLAKKKTTTQAMSPSTQKTTTQGMSPSTEMEYVGLKRRMDGLINHFANKKPISPEVITELKSILALYESLNQKYPEVLKEVRTKKELIESFLVLEREEETQDVSIAPAVPILSDDEKKEHDRALSKAIREGNLAEVKKIVERDGRVHYFNMSSPLRDATSSNNIAIMSYLIEQKADVNEKPPSGPPALKVAATNCNNRAIRLLVDNGARLTQEYMPPLNKIIDDCKKVAQEIQKLENLNQKSARTLILEISEKYKLQKNLPFQFFLQSMPLLYRDTIFADWKSYHHLLKSLENNGIIAIRLVLEAYDQSVDIKTYIESIEADIQECFLRI